MNLASIVRDHPGHWPALVHEGNVVSYGQLAEGVERMAGGLLGAGMVAGDRVAVVLANTPDFAVAYLGALHAGLVAVPLNPLSPGPELSAQLRGVQATAAVARADLVDAVASCGAELPQGVATVGDWSADPIGTPVTISSDDPAVLLYTSGTAGAPRAAVLTHGNLAANIDQLRRHPGRLGADTDVVLGVLPLSHVFGLNAVLGFTLASGGTLVLYDRFDPARIVAELSEHGITVVAGAPSLWSALLDAPGAGPEAFAGIRLATSGAAHLPEVVARRSADELGVDLRQGYGLTEAAPVVSSAIGTTAPATSVGVPLPGVEVRLVDPGGGDALVGDEGEVWVRGPNVFAGYWDDPPASARALTPDGWLRTGDVAVVDELGHLYLVDRAKDLIIVSGFNVYPAEVEDVLAEHPAVADAGVVGVADERTGEAVAAFVVLEPGASASTGELTAHVAGRLARYKCPTSVSVVDELPRGPGGKLLRRLIDPAAAG